MTAQFFSFLSAHWQQEVYFYVYVLLRLITGFMMLLAYFYLSGRTQLSQMNSIDMIGNFIFGGIIGGAIYSDQGSYLHYLGILCLALAVLLGVNYLSRRSYILRTVAIGHPIPIIKDGQFLMQNVLNKSNKVDMINITSQLNAQGLYFDEIYYAQVEPSGLVTAISDEAKLPATVVMSQGKFYYDELKNIHKTDKNVLADMKRNGIKNASDVYLADYKNGTFKYITNDGKIYPKRPHAQQTAKAQKMQAFSRKAAARSRKLAA